MLEKPNRVNNKLFSEIYENGKTANSRNVYIKYLHLSGEKTKITFGVSSKKIKRAVDRNLLKRRGRAIISKYRNKILSGYAVIIFLNKKILSTELEKEIISLLKNINLIN